MKLKMRKIAIIILFLGLATGCSKSDHKKDVESLLSKWTFSIKKLDYKNYTDCVKVPKSKEHFNEMYKSFYLSTPVVLKITESENPNKLVVDFEAEMIKRKGTSRFSTMKVNAEIRRTGEDNKNWKISNRTIIRSDI